MRPLGDWVKRRRVAQRYGCPAMGGVIEGRKSPGESLGFEHRRRRLSFIAPGQRRVASVRLSVGIPKNPPRSYRKSFHEEYQQLSPLAQGRTVHPVLLPPRAVSLDLPRRKSLFGEPSSVAGSRSSLDERVRNGGPWDGIVGTRSRARVAFSVVFSRISGGHQERLKSDSD